MSPRQVDQQLATNLLGPMNVARAVLPVMRRQRSGHVIAISSCAGLVGFEYSSVYAASKFALEGWMGRSARRWSRSASSSLRPLITVANEDPPPRRFIAGADAIALAERKIVELQAQIGAHC